MPESMRIRPEDMPEITREARLSEVIAEYDVLANQQIAQLRALKERLGAAAKPADVESIDAEISDWEEIIGMETIDEKEHRRAYIMAHHYPRDPNAPDPFGDEWKQFMVDHLQDLPTSPTIH